MNTKNMTAKQLANMTLEQFESLNIKQTNDALTILNKAVNRQVKRIVAAGFGSSPALESLAFGGGKIKTRGHENINEAKAELKRAMDFLNLKTSTVTGARAHHKQAARYFGLPESATPREVTEISKEVDKILEEYPAEFAKTLGQSYQTIAGKISERIQKGNTPEQIRDALQSQYERLKGGEIDTTKSYSEQLWTEFDSELEQIL